MDVALTLLALLLKLAGAAFLLAAALGVLRFADPFQRMHAATKAGTLGAGLVVLGSVLTLGSLSALLMGGLTLLFLLATIPIAGHLLGRAAYVSGAVMAEGEDALAGVLPRAGQPLEQRLRQAAEGPAPEAAGPPA
ncbi:monovalent cation/H(+) antiporter subunit G [Pseudoroseomonas cervicalis]|uniref:monovalent cation/H(+) antiporter subunit G n=1 Tax=Teichococcus cervicalis TaxID=204525 RepID=UPI00277D2EBC|nr:monovalent cation/H(+) antiporter subunit G [Pseudoroseomonas cervicalis]MDQ1081506.1 monovalent cation/proton antiporter MnhG/PhaG subunit [Pseudoroseomonas cervicalis]